MDPVNEIVRRALRPDSVQMDPILHGLGGRARVLAGNDMDFDILRFERVGEVVEVTRDSADDLRRIFPAEHDDAHCSRSSFRIFGAEGGAALIPQPLLPILGEGESEFLELFKIFEFESFQIQNPDPLPRIEERVEALAPGEGRYSTRAVAAWWPMSVRYCIPSNEMFFTAA